MYPARIIPELARKGWQAHGLALENSRIAESFRDAGIEPLTVSSKGRAVWGVWRILDYLKRHDIQVVHCHKSSDLQVGALLKQLHPTLRLFFTDHMGVTRPKKDPYHRWSYGKLTRLFSISEATRQRNLNAFPLPPERIQRLYLGIDVAEYAPKLDRAGQATLRAELGVPEGAVAIGLPGRLTPGKGQDTWLEALALLRKRHPELTFHGVIIGGLLASEGSDEAYVARLKGQAASLLSERRLTFTGYRHDLPRLLEVLDLVCVPSTNEAFGLTVIEAMAAGKAVIGADSGAIPELLDETCGRLAPPDDAGAWADIMALLVSDATLRQTLGDAAQRMARQRFSVVAHITALIEAYAGSSKAHPDSSKESVE
ncbi:glycosyltransferase family 4 protein [Halomonas sp. PA5]|nr:glycosyltransferase family 4 protein [Halomonas sp. PA5]